VVTERIVNRKTPRTLRLHKEERQNTLFVTTRNPRNLRNLWMIFGFKFPSIQF